MGNSSQRYGAAPVIWDHTVTCQPTDTGKRTPPLAQRDRPMLDLPTAEGRKVELTLTFVTYLDCLSIRRHAVTHPSSTYLMAPTRPIESRTHDLPIVKPTPYRVKGGYEHTLSEIMFIALIHNRIARHCVLDVRFMKVLSLTTENIIKMC